MTQQDRPTGVCLIRVQSQSAALVITVIENPDISNRQLETTRSYSDVSAVLDGVREFLGRFAPTSAANGTDCR
jgi:hypothetical protein